MAVAMGGEERPRAPGTGVEGALVKRPIGVWVISFIAIAAGVLYLLAGLQQMGIVVFGPVQAGNGLWFSGLVAFAAGVVFVAAGVALWLLQPWALAFTMLMGVFGLLAAGFTLLATGDLASGLGQAILPGFLLWYASRADIQETFTF
jgi:hypothetical protein